MLRCNTARGFGTGLSLVGPTKVKASKSFLFSEDFLRVDISCYICSMRQNGVLVNYEKYGTLYIDVDIDIDRH